MFAGIMDNQKLQAELHNYTVMDHISSGANIDRYLPF